MSTTEMTYTLSAIESASPIGLMVVLFDTLAGDLHRAVAALNRSDIETRCKELNHASLVIGQLEAGSIRQRWRVGAKSGRILCISAREDDGGGGKPICQAARSADSNDLASESGLAQARCCSPAGSGKIDGKLGNYRCRSRIREKTEKNSFLLVRRFCESSMR